MTISDDLPITVDPEIMSGAPVFTGTRVPVSALLENLENFPTVTREQAVGVLEYFRTSPKDISNNVLAE